MHILKVNTHTHTHLFTLLLLLCCCLSVYLSRIYQSGTFKSRISYILYPVLSTIFILNLLTVTKLVFLYNKLFLHNYIFYVEEKHVYTIFS